MILCLGFLICALNDLAFAHEEEIPLFKHPPSFPHYKGQGISIFISNETISPLQGQQFSYSIISQDVSLQPESFLMVCSSVPTVFSEYIELTRFILNSCESVIQVSQNSFLEASMHGCARTNLTKNNILLVSYVSQSQLPEYLALKENSVQVMMKIRNTTCNNVLRTVAGLHGSKGVFHIDVMYTFPNANSTNAHFKRIKLEFSGVFGDSRKCRRIIAWTKQDKTFTYLSQSNSSPFSFDAGLSSGSVIIRCLLMTNEATLNEENLFMSFLSYSHHSQSPFIIQVEDTKHSFHHPPVSLDNPYICYSHSQNSPPFIPVQDMKISGVSPYNNVEVDVTVLACLSDSDAREKFCVDNFLPIFSQSQVNLPVNSSFLVGPSFGRGLFALLFHKREKVSFCLDIISFKNSLYTIDVMLFAAPGGIIPPQSYHSIDLSCPYKYGESINAIMYRTHTHSFGQYVSMWVEHRNTWTLLAFENRTNAIIELSKPFHIRVNDTMNVRCTYDTHGVNNTIFIDQGGEMCNFYLYYITNSSTGIDVQDCFRETKLTPPYDKHLGLHHQLSRHRVTYGTNLELASSWSLQAQSSQGNLGICNLEHSGTVLVILERYSRHFSQDKDWFTDQNVLVDFHSVIKTNALTVFNMQNNSVIHSAGANRFYLPTGLYITNEGEIFITDLGLHQVVKFSKVQFHPRDSPELALGTAFHPGNDSTHFCKPTSVVTDPEDNIYVGDGLCNSRIVKFEDDGYYLGSYGKPSFERGLPGTFGEVTDLAIDTTRAVILALDNKLLQIQVMDFFGNFYQVIDVSKYKNILKICYSPDMDTILILTSYELQSFMFILDPVTGYELSFISAATRTFSAITIIPGNNTVLVGDRDGMISMYSSNKMVTNEDSDSSKSTHQDNSVSEIEELDEQLSKLSPLIHILYKPGLAEVDKEEPADDRHYKLSRRLTMIVSTSAVAMLLLIVLIVFTMTYCGRCNSKPGYEKFLLSESEEEEDVLYDTLHESYENMKAL